MQNFNSAELRPVEFARAYLQKKMLKKPLGLEMPDRRQHGNICR